MCVTYNAYIRRLFAYDGSVRVCVISLRTDENGNLIKCVYVCRQVVNCVYIIC